MSARSDRSVPVPGDTIEIGVGDWGITFVVDAARRLRQVTVGPAALGARLDFPAELYRRGYVAFGEDPLADAALVVTHADGTLSTRLVVVGVVRSADSPEHTVIELCDEVLPFRVELHFVADSANGVLEQHVEIHHDESATVLVSGYDSLGWFLPAGEMWLTGFGGGGWAREWVPTRRPVGVGTTELASRGGIQPGLDSAPVALLEPAGAATETSGTALGISVGWTGNSRIRLERRLDGSTRLLAGANPFAAPYRLDPGAVLRTPSVAVVWSEFGFGMLSRRFHRWLRERVIRDPDRLRPIVANTWEAMYFDLSPERLADFAERAADAGADLVLLDDGWFGTAHPRVDDTAGLGDWRVDTNRLPGGLRAVAQTVRAAGLEFGIWTEPEMVNPQSELAAAHPDWVQADHRVPLQHRSQLVLDTLQPEVAEFVVAAVDAAIEQADGASYVKWDANRPVMDPASSALAPDRQANVFVDQAWRTEDLFAETARRHPEVVLMLCASGGGRVNHGTLRHCHESWPSDNTDPVDRVSQQWGYGQVFPAATMAAHLTTMGGRPIEFAAAVALAGRFGFDIDFAALDADAMAVCRRASQIARRTQPIVQFGELFRLCSPVPDESPGAVWAYRRGAEIFVVAAQIRPANGLVSVDVSPVLDGWSGGPSGAVSVEELSLTGEPADPVVLPRERLRHDGLAWQLGGAETALLLLLRAAPTGTRVD
jgi:alpha-galactosidase